MPPSSAAKKNGKPKYVTKAAILGHKPKEEDFDVPEWGGKVHIKALDADTGGDILEATGGGTQFSRFNLMLVYYGVVDQETGERLFSEGELSELSKTSFAPILAVGGRVAELSGLADKAVSDAGKDSSPTTAG